MISFAVLAGTVFTIAASAMELTNVNARKSHLQAANDAAALMAAKKFGESHVLDQNEATKSLNANLAAIDLKGVNSKLSIETIDGVSYVKLATDAKFDTFFSGVVTMNQISLHAESYVLTAAKKVELAFVLDTTGSLAWNNRIGSLKAAMSTTFDTIATSGEDVKFGVVPFNTAVKIEPNKNANWTDWGTAERVLKCQNSSNYPDFCKAAQLAVDGLCFEAIDRMACKANAKFFHKAPYVLNGRTYYEIVAKSYELDNGGYKVFTRSLNYSKNSNCWSNNCNAAPAFEADNQLTFSAQPSLSEYYNTPVGMSPSSIQYKEEFSTANGFGTPQESQLIYQALNSTSPRAAAFPTNLKDQWEGCIIDRNMNFDISAESPNPSVPDSLYPARSCKDSPYLPKILPLTNDIQKGRDTVQAITPNGFTNITIGVQWGMELLSPTDPLTGGVQFFDQETRKIMIVITDGENTKNRYTTNSAEIDFRTKQACQSAKAKGIEVFTVRLEDGDENLLKNCASSPDNYFDVKQAANLTNAMQAIMSKVSKLRLAK